MVAFPRIGLLSAAQCVSRPLFLPRTQNTCARQHKLIFALDSVAAVCHPSSLPFPCTRMYVCDGRKFHRNLQSFAAASVAQMRRRRVMSPSLLLSEALTTAHSRPSAPGSFSFSHALFCLFVHRNAEIWLGSAVALSLRRRKLLLYFAVRNLGAIGAAGAFASVCVCERAIPGLCRTARAVICNNNSSSVFRHFICAHTNDCRSRYIKDREQKSSIFNFWEEEPTVC
jgi:hypothetical protein